MSVEHIGTDYVVSPGEILEDFLDSRDLNKQDFATRCGRSAKFISEIISGKAPLNEETAIQFGRVLDTDPLMWVNLESNYRLKIAQQQDAEVLQANMAWAKRFPISDMKRYDLIDVGVNPRDISRAVLSFFKAANPQALDRVVQQQVQTLAFRRSKSLESNPLAVMTWLQWGEHVMRGIEVAEYNASKFRAALQRIRSLTRADAAAIQSATVEACAEAGVRLVFTPELRGTCLSGATRWIGDNPLIQLSLRHKSDDHLWFTFFHEAAHVLLHGKKAVFLDEGKDNHLDDDEREADEFARDYLIAPKAWSKFVTARGFTKENVLAFSEECGIAPGIIVGRLQHEKRIVYKTNLNFLKQTFRWNTT